MSEWTEDEIEAARAAFIEDLRVTLRCCGPVTLEKLGEWTFRSATSAALSAVKRVPEGYWLAPDEPTDAMLAAIPHMEDSDCYDIAVYRAMRDAARKP